MPELSFEQQIIRLKHFFFKETVKRILIIWLFLTVILAAVSVTIQFMATGGLLQSVVLIVYLILLLISVIFILRTKNSFEAELIAVDRQFGLDERLSTAYEYASSQKPSAFFDTLLNTATVDISELNFRRIHTNPGLIHQRYTLGAGAFLILMTAVWLAFFPGKPALNRTPEEARLEQEIESRLRTTLSEMESLEPENQRSRTREEIEQLSKDLAEQTLTPDQLLDSIESALIKARAERRRLAKDLRDQLSGGNLASAKELENLSQETNSAAEFRKAAQQLRDLFENGPPPALGREISRLVAQRELEDFLEKSIEDLQPSASAQQAGDPEEGGGDQQGAVASAKEQSDDLPDQDTPFADPSNQSQANNTPQINQGESGQPGNPSDSQPGQSLVDPNAISKAGDKTGSGEDQASYQPESSTESHQSVAGDAAPGEWYRIQVRSVTAIGDVTVSEDKVVRSYEKDIKTVFEKENIPQNYRQFIRNYFLSIGLKEES